jgi:cation:H+ antiporter
MTGPSIHILDVLGALGALALILGGCELFTNAVEWAGRRLKLSEGMVGSVLAAVGTALPETTVPLVALLWGRAPGHEEIGIGAILGAPLMLATLGFAMTGLAAFVFSATGRRQSRHLDVDVRTLGHDFSYFSVVYCVAVLVGLGAPRWVRVAAAAALVGAYAIYVWVHLRRQQEGGDKHLADLRFGVLAWALGRWRHRRRIEAEGLELEVLFGGHGPHWPRLRWIAVQLLVSLALIVGGAKLFVGSLSGMALALGVSPLLLSLVVTPIATELPEKTNSVLWVRVGKDTLALGNISGAMVFQSCIPVALGLLLTDWVIAPRAMLSALVALVSAVIVQLSMVRFRRLSPKVLLLGLPLYALWLTLAVTVFR